MKHLTGQPCPCCQTYDNRGVTVDAIIVDGKNVLLIKRGVEPYKGLWGTPGGYLEWDETIEDTVKREVREETGLTVRRVEFFRVYSAPSRHPKQAISVAFVVEAAGEPRAADDVTEVSWFDVNDLPKPLAFDHATIIRDYLGACR